MPKVSVLMPVYKTNEQYLEDSIKSILAQTYKDFEFLILDDCPSDPREEVVKRFNDDRIIYLKNETNLGISSSRNKLLQFAKGDYVAIFDHDDISLPTRLEKEVKVLDDCPEIGVVSCNIQLLSTLEVTDYPLCNNDIKIMMLQGNYVAHTGAMIRKSVLLKYNIQWEEQYTPEEDYVLWARLLDKTMFLNLKEPLIQYRDLEGNTTHTRYHKMQDLDIIVKAMINQKFGFLKECGLSHKTYKWIYLFSLIPFIKIAKSSKHKKYFLFGFLPLLKI